MPRLPVVSGAEAIAALKRAGFVVVRQSGSHRILRNLDTRRQAVISAHGGQTIAAGTLRAIIRGAGLTVEEFRQLLK